ncbi:hypothetical protein AAZX31_14G135400 [Glycine max]
MEDNALVLLLYVGRHKWKLLMSPLLLMLLRISPLASSFSEEEKVEEDTKVVIFISKKLRFLSPFHLKQRR